MKNFLKILLVLTSVLGSCISGNHLINDKQYLSEVESAFLKRKYLATNRDSALYSVFRKKLTTEQDEGMKFLYAYMPLSDLADYSGNFFLANVNSALRARQDMPWGKAVPEDIFLHYVLPFRVNNENLDSFRIAYYDEINARIKGIVNRVTPLTREISADVL